MSNKKAIILLVLGILILAAAHLFLSFRGVGNDLLPRQTLLDLPGRKDAVTRIALVRDGADPLVLEPAAGGWRVTEPFAALADERAVMRLQDALALSPVRGVYREQELLDFGRTRDDYGLAEPALTVTVTVDGKDLSVAFGSPTATGDGVFATRGEDASIYVVGADVLEAAGPAPDAFRLRALCPRGTAGVDGFLLKRAANAVSSFRLRDGAWSKVRVGEEDGAEPASATNVRDLLARLDAAQAVDFVWPTGAPDEPEIATAPFLAQYGLDSESAVTLTLQRPSLTERDQIAFGKPATNGLVYALVQNGRAIVTVDGDLSEFVRTADFTDSRLFPFEDAAVDRFSVGDGAITCRLAKGEDAAWALEEPVAAPADKAKAELLLSRVLLLAATNRAEKGLSVSVRPDGPTETVARDALLGDFSLPDLRSPEILNVTASDVRRVTLTSSSAEKPTSVVYDKDLLCWTVESSGTPGTVSVPAVTKLLAALAPLRAEKVVLLKATAADLRRYGLEEPRYKLTVDPARDGILRRVLLIGKASQGGRFATLVGASESVFILSDETVADLTAPLVTDKSDTKGSP